MSSPPLTGRLPPQASESFATGSSRPPALIQRRQRLIYELRLCKLANLSRSAPQPATHDLAVAQPTTVLINRLIRSPEPAGNTLILYILIYNLLDVTMSRAEHVGRARPPRRHGRPSREWLSLLARNWL